MECLMTKVFALLIKALTLTYRILATIHKINHYKMCHLVSALSYTDHLFSKACNKLLSKNGTTGEGIVLHRVTYFLTS